jgi:hypothetical protein
MESLTTAPIADLLKGLFQKAEAADRPLAEAFSNEGEGFSAISIDRSSGNVE